MDLLYLKLAQENNFEPNFWCAPLYLSVIGAVEERHSDGYVCLITGEEGEQTLFPPIPVSHYMNGLAEKGIECPNTRDIWAGFSNTVFPSSGCKTLLDHEFIYDPAEFTRMKGKKWMKFRKNSRKWMRRKIFQEGWEDKRDIRFIQLKEGECDTEVFQLIEKWLTARGDDSYIHDGETLLKCAAIYPFRLALVSPSSGRVWAISIWDYSWKYINYRWIIVDPEEPFLDECMRLSFYLEMHRRHPGVFVNDGGNLDNEGLYRFKESINPIAINKIYSWERNKE